MAIDYTLLSENPCEAVKALKPIVLERIVEGQVKRIEFNNRVLEFHSTDIADLRSLITELEAECAELSGTSRKRRKFAISAGYRRY